MSVPRLCGYILIQKESQSVQGVNRYDILFAGMSNVWKRYLFANPVTYIAIQSCKIGNALFADLITLSYMLCLLFSLHLLVHISHYLSCIADISVHVCPLTGKKGFV